MSEPEQTATDATLLVDASESNSDLLWASGFDAVDPFPLAINDGTRATTYP